MKAGLQKLPRHWIGLVVLTLSLIPAAYALARTPVPSPTFQSPPETPSLPAVPMFQSPVETPSPPAATTFESPVETPSPPPTTSPPAASTQPSTSSILGYHTIREGETLYCVARAYGVDPFAIADANGIVNPNVVLPGMVLAIPNAPRALPSGRTCARQFAAGTGASAVAASGCRWIHPVSRGQNLFRISLRYGVSMSAIVQANGISNPNLIYAGQSLCIP